MERLAAQKQEDDNFIVRYNIIYCMVSQKLMISLDEETLKKLDSERATPKGNISRSEYIRYLLKSYYKKQEK